MEKKSKIEKYPILRYLSYLVIVSILLTGVSLARYTGASSGDIGTTLSRFVCSYRISDASSLVFSNTDFWLELEGEETSATNTARTVRFDIANYVDREGAVDRISSVDLQSTLRFYAPAEFTGNLAVQVLSADAENGAYTAITPQYVLKDLIYTPEKTFASGERIVDTKDSEDYSDCTDGLTGEEIAGLEQKLRVSGGFTGTEDRHTGVIRAEAENGATLSIASSMQTARYSVGFLRSTVSSGSTEVGGGSAQETLELPLFIDCEREMPFYTLDITLPQMYFDAADPQSKSFVLCFTTISRTENGDYSAVWGESAEAVIGGAADSWDDLLKTPAGSNEYTLNGAKVTGYHFVRRLPAFRLSDDGTLTENGDTSVRITKTYDYQGNAQLSYDHVAPVSEDPGSSSVEHPITDFYRYSGNAMTSDTSVDHTSVTGVNGDYKADGVYLNTEGLYGLCSNGGKSEYIWFANLSDDPYYETYTQQQDAGGHIYKLSDALSKGYSSTLNVIFAQASESPGRQGGAA